MSTPPAGNKPLPEVIPPPTYAPSFMAAGIVFLVWGFLTKLLVTLAGIVLMIVSLVLWLREIRNDWENEK